MKFYFTLLLSLMFSLSITAVAQKLKAEEIVQKHIASIGTAEARLAAENRMAVGDGSVKYVSQKNSTADGRLVLASSAGKNYLGMNFNSPDYPLEKFSFDGDKVKVAFLRVGVRSVLGNFILSNNLLLEESLFSGVLSTSWGLLDTSGKKAKLSSDGIKKIDGKEVFVVDYSPKNGSDVDIKLYFDKETFHHVRTEYKRISSASIGTRPEQSSGFIETRYKVTEEYSDFKTENNITLPHHYSINYTSSGQNGTTEIQWQFNMMQFVFNQKFAANSFDAEAN